jgi:ketosteroid isomerase-like protein
MSSESENVAILRRAYNEWHACKAGSLDCWIAVTATNISLKSLADGAGEVEFTKQRNGKEAFLEYLRGLTADWEMISYTIDEFIAQGDRVVAVGQTSWRNKKTGKAFDTPKIDLWTMSDGRAVRFAEYYDTAKIFAAAAP